jgi:hypothetical protein
MAQGFFHQADFSVERLFPFAYKGITAESSKARTLPPAFPS